MSVSYRVQSVQYQRQREKTEEQRRRCLQTKQVQPTLCCQSHPFFTNNCFTGFAQALLKVDDAVSVINRWRAADVTYTVTCLTLFKKNDFYHITLLPNYVKMIHILDFITLKSYNIFIARVPAALKHTPHSLLLGFYLPGGL